MPGPSPRVLTPRSSSASHSEKAPMMLAGWRRWPITRWSRAKILDPCIAIFTNGTDPYLVAFSLALGFAVGLFPLCGTTSALCILVSLLLRSVCHAPTMVFATFAATPVELMLIVPYVRLGEVLLNLDHMDFSPSAIFEALQGKASRDLLVRILGSVFAWLLTVPVIVWVTYKLFLPISLRMSKKPQGASSPQTGPVLVSKTGEQLALARHAPGPPLPPLGNPWALQVGSRGGGP